MAIIIDLTVMFEHQNLHNIFHEIYVNKTRISAMKIGKYRQRYRHQLAVCQMLFVLSRLQHSPDGSAKIINFFILSCHAILYYHYWLLQMYIITLSFVYVISFINEV